MDTDSPTFLYAAWLQDTLAAFLASEGTAKLKGRAIRLTPRQYGAALAQAYLGQANLAWIAAATGNPLTTLKAWRREPGFLLIMDWSKNAFADYFRDFLTGEDYTLPQYYEIAGEFALLEDSLRLRLRTGLYGAFKALGEKLQRLHQVFQRPEAYDIHLFRRLFLFFYALETYWPSPAAPRLQAKFIPLAQELIWPLLRQEWPEAEFQSLKAHYPLALIRDLVANYLNLLFAALPSPSAPEKSVS
jgi:hypothetical protein